MRSIFELLFGSALMFLLALAVVLINDRQKARRDRKAGIKRPKAAFVPGWFYWAYFLAMIGLYLLSRAGRPRSAFAEEPRPGLPPWAWVLAGTGGLAILLAMLYLFAHRRSRLTRKLLGRADAGDVDGAIAEARAILDARGPSVERLRLLGLLFSKKEDWSSADEWFVEAIGLGGRTSLLLGEHGVMLWKMGRAEDAAVVLQEASTLSPLDFTIAFRYCQVLADLGRIEEGREQLARVEALRKTTYVMGAEVRKALDEMVAECWKRLGGKKQVEGLEEL